MTENAIIYTLFVIFSGTALVSTLALSLRQSLMVAYMIVGMIVGPFGVGWIDDAKVIEQIGDIGILFLLFLLGLHLDPSNLYNLLRKTTSVSLMSAVLFAVIGAGVGLALGIDTQSVGILAASMMFSSTIVGLKLLPTTILHHRPLGEMMISVLLMQDLLAIVVLLGLKALSLKTFGWYEGVTMILALPILLTVSFLVERYGLVPLFHRFEGVREYLFLLAIGWCLSVAQLAHLMGLSHEIGAFVAGVSIAVSPISLYLAECLQPVRDFFLVLFFFAVGANMNTALLVDVGIPALVLGGSAILFKPILLRTLFGWYGETHQRAWELGWRLGQMSEFSLLVVYIATASGLIEASVSAVVQAATILTLMVSPFIVELKYGGPDARARDDL